MNLTNPSPHMAEAPVLTPAPPATVTKGEPSMQSPQTVNVLRGGSNVVPFKPRLKNPARVARLLAQAETIAADPRTSEQRRQVMADAIATYRRQLDTCKRCRRCGRALSDPVSVARHIGPECLTKGAVA